nr:MAG TPA: hypothetical protein [Caudoviricetes sp.]
MVTVNCLTTPGHTPPHTPFEPLRSYSLLPPERSSPKLYVWRCLDWQSQPAS